MGEKKSSILLFENELLLSDLIQLSLEQEGYSVTVQHTPNDSLNLIKQLHPDLILLDLFFPQTQTIQMIKEIRQLAFEPSIDIIVLSALGFREVVQKALDAGAKEYLLKPLDIPLLIERVNKVIQSQVPKQEKNIKVIAQPFFRKIR